MKNEIYTNNIATRSFRNIADQDYIAARICHRNGLTLQFLWMAQQAVEKYLKAILIYNGIETQHLSHHLKKSINKIIEIPGMTLDLSTDVLNFITYLDHQGPNRYLEKEMYTHGDELLKLDKCVWEIRRYCKVLNYSINLREGESVNLFKNEIEIIHRWKASKNKHLFKINNGYLEMVLESKSKKYKMQKEMIIWKNFYYGKIKKNSIQWERSIKTIIPTQIVHPEGIEVIRKLVKLPKK
ncbi:HEPN domain-containing protein [Serratia marcescens]|uniref:HEPN domain-containing protein n=1 Tax=Serratia marcescens TaxID=615 RepID=UPI0027901996|nr:HEPN domain-containing protein [Serratia marcescens]MDP8800903.1 HEPN domain-containing protein [Serratia marcescens]